jgi:hypothetical protein
VSGGEERRGRFSNLLISKQQIKKKRDEGHNK